jgi:hypothetical protein
MGYRTTNFNQLYFYVASLMANLAMGTNGPFVKSSSGLTNKKSNVTVISKSTWNETSGQWILHLVRC